MKKKNIEDFDKKIQDYNPSNEEILAIENLADKYMDKTDDDIFVEIIRVNSEIEKQMTEEQYAAIFEKLESLKPMLSEEQNAKLDKIIEVLKKEKK